MECTCRICVFVNMFNKCLAECSNWDVWDSVVTVPVFHCWSVLVILWEKVVISISVFFDQEICLVWVTAMATRMHSV